MANIYVRTTGNDTTGTGATGAPYLTVDKALATAADGDRIWIGAGTYAESTGGAGYLMVNKTAAVSGIILSPENGVPGSVTIKGTGTAWGTIVSNSTGIHFDGITFEAQTDTVQGALRFIAATLTDVTFTRCEFVAYPSTTVANVAVNSSMSNPSINWSGLRFIGCKIRQLGRFAGSGMVFDCNPSNSVATVSIDVIDCDFDMGGIGMRLNGISWARVLGNRVRSWYVAGASTAFQLGIDGSASRPTAGGIVAGNRFYSINGHGAVLGIEADGVTFENNTVIGGRNSSSGQGLVVKGASNCLIRRNTITAGWLSGLYFKGSTDCQAFENTIINEYATSPALRVGINDDGATDANSGLVIRRNEFVVYAGKAISWGDATHDSGGSVCDENVYVLRGAGTLGTVRGTDVTTLAGLRAAWGATGYNRRNNDRNSRLGAKHAPFAGTPLADLPA